MAKGCLVCSAKVCKPYWLYVVEDPTRGLSKVGISSRVTQRLTTYRRDGGVPDIIMRHKHPAGCEFTALTLEENAHKRLAKRFSFLRGDWADAPVEESIRALGKPVLGRAHGP